jgi:aspartate racemase
MLGIVGGIAPASTVEYYRRIIDGYRAVTKKYPPLLLTSIDLDRVIRLVQADARTEVLEFLGGELQRLAAGGAGMALFASNTPHIYFDELQRHSPIPLISIVEATSRVVQRHGWRRVGLLGTRFTMERGPYRPSLAHAGIHVAVPTPEDMTIIHSGYMGELIEGQFREETRSAFRAVMRRMRDDEGIEAVILGGTEIPLLLHEPTYDGLAMLDTTRIHIEAAVAEMLRA